MNAYPKRNKGSLELGNTQEKKCKRTIAKKEEASTARH